MQGMRTASDDPLLQEQVAYYRARAAEYDEWWYRTGRYDRGPEHRAAWQREIAVVLFQFPLQFGKRQPARSALVQCGQSAHDAGNVVQSVTIIGNIANVLLAL